MGGRLNKYLQGPPLAKKLPLMDRSSLLLRFCIFAVIAAVAVAQDPGDVPKLGPYKPEDNYLLNCGSPDKTVLPDGRTFAPDNEMNQYLDTKEVIRVLNNTAEVPLPIYQTARVFTKTTTFTFKMKAQGWHWVRLHFFPIEDAQHNLKTSTFDVQTEQVTLLHAFSMSNEKIAWQMKEYLLNITSDHLALSFLPRTKSTAFINAIEVTSAPSKLITDTGFSLEAQGEFAGLSNQAYEVVHRLNMGGPLVTPQNDTLYRTWNTDSDYLKEKRVGKSVETSTTSVKYPQDRSVTDMIAPSWVYATAIQSVGKFQVTWNFNDIEVSHSHLVRLHFCDIVSKSFSGLYFNVYINGKKAIHALNFESVVTDLSVPFYKDIVVDSASISDGLTVQIGPADDGKTETAILNGLEILRMNNSANSLQGLFGPQDLKGGMDATKKGVAAVGFAMMFGAFVGLGAMVVKWQRRPKDWERRNSFSSWLLPLHAGHSTYMTSKTSVGSHKSGFYSSTIGSGRYFSFAELQDATKNFDQNAVIGVGGFGNVYVGELDDGTQVAVKRGNPQSEQGINEFQTEIQMLSKLRHRHLVSLIGYCDENSEMILVYEYMSNGPLRDHLYGKNMKKPLSWKQRLEICIGSARGLHYLHTGAAQGIIHRDVKTTNILLDENFVAKMADFGLSKDAPGMGQTHVSTAVKGSFGYLDPEYFRRQQLTDKSDVYSFGVVLLEVLCARPALDPSLPREQVNLAEWGMQWKRKGLLQKIVDPELVDNINPESMKKFAEAAEKCLAEYGVDRPSMGDVLWNLEYALQLHEAASQGKTDDDNNGVTVASTNDDPHPHPSSSINTFPAEVEAIPELSGTDMIAKMGTNLSGR